MAEAKGHSRVLPGKDEPFYGRLSIAGIDFRKDMHIIFAEVLYEKDSVKRSLVRV